MTNHRQMAEFPIDAFKGTSHYYAKYRVAYPKALIDDLLARIAVSGHGRLLDLGCGPGRVALALADSFSEVVAADLEPEMTDTGRESASVLGITNVRWVVDRAEDLKLEPSSFELITFGESFHRMDQALVCKNCLDWL